METIRFVAERRYPWIALPYSQFDVMKEHFEMLREYAATHCGYDVPPAQIGWPAMIYVGETDRQAREEFEPHFWYLAKKGLRLPREYMFPPGHTSVESQLRPSHVKRKFISLLSSWREAEEGTYAIVGSAETVRQKLREGIKAAGCGIIQGIFQVGSMPHDLTMRSMERFARDVMPALRAEFP
jgi:alkanesulfonate monooxygenase SsuD/methylene tetrahydromethanopterin reductase-like flavin-dependent oxidoreductase (luciferase family)